MTHPFSENLKILLKNELVLNNQILLCHKMEGEVCKCRLIKTGLPGEGASFMEKKVIIQYKQLYSIDEIFTQFL